MSAKLWLIELHHPTLHTRYYWERTWVRAENIEEAMEQAVIGWADTHRTEIREDDRLIEVRRPGIPYTPAEYSFFWSVRTHQVRAPKAELFDTSEPCPLPPADAASQRFFTNFRSAKRARRQQAFVRAHREAQKTLDEREQEKRDKEMVDFLLDDEGETAAPRIGDEKWCKLLEDYLTAKGGDRAIIQHELEVRARRAGAISYAEENQAQRESDEEE